MAFFKKTPKSDNTKVIIVGAGEVGFEIAKRLVQEHKLVLIIDNNIEKLNKLKDKLDVQTILGSGTDPKCLTDADIANSQFFIAVTNNDDANIAACFLAKVLNPNISKLIRLREANYYKYPAIFAKDALDVNIMVNPEFELANTINRLLTLPDALEYADLAGGRLRMVAYKITSGQLINKTLKDFKEVVKNEAVIVAAISRKAQTFIPSGDDKILENDIVYFVYMPSSQIYLLKALNKMRAFFSSACIIGGGQIGLRLAQLFEEKKIDVKLIENNQARCEELAEILDGTLVIHGDGTDTSLLQEENIQNSDVVVAVTSDEESNILSCLLAKSLGVEDTVARINKAAYLSILPNIGISHSVSPRQAAVNRFLNYMRKGKILASANLGGDAAEILDAELLANSKLVKKAIKDMQIPKGILILAIIREENVFIPNGNTILEANDRIIISATRKLIPNLEEILE